MHGVASSRFWRLRMSKEVHTRTHADATLSPEAKAELAAELAEELAEADEDAGE
jgi:hypothetical protein